MAGNVIQYTFTHFSHTPTFFQDKDSQTSITCHMIYITLLLQCIKRPLRYMVYMFKRDKSPSRVRGPQLPGSSFNTHTACSQTPQNQSILLQIQKRNITPFCQTAADGEVADFQICKIIHFFLVLFCC